jgi:hypothetical protein
VHPETWITGTLPDDENVTEHPVGATTWNGTVTLTELLVVAFEVVDVVGAAVGLCAARYAQ